MSESERNVMKALTVILMLSGMLVSQSVEDILERVDNNAVVTTARYTATMVISLGGKVREKTFFGYTEGKERTYMEFTAPARDYGTRILKLGDEMWIYIPAVEKATKIAGHMLRQSMMGSDFSYEDVAENRRLEELYDAEILGIDTIDDRPCHKLRLTARVDEVAYALRVVWIDTDEYIALKTELYAKSGKLMKEVTVSEFRKIGGHNYPTRVKMVNKLRQNTYTELILEDVQLDAALPERVFTKAHLERQ